MVILQNIKVYYKRGCHEGDERVSKASQENNIPTKIIQENAGIFSNFIYRALIKWLIFEFFQHDLNQQMSFLSSSKGQKFKEKL